jgi:hypothetical protein
VRRRASATVVLAAAVVLGPAAVPAAPDATPALVRTVAGAEVDWAAGVIQAQGGSAADYRLPSPEIARPGAERRARAAATAELRAALQALPLTAERRLSPAAIAAAVARAHTASVEYQSNGGAVVKLALRFAEVNGAAGDEPPAKPPLPPLALAVPAMPLELAPRVVAGESEAQLAWVVYRIGRPPGDALAVRRDREGRLVLPRGERSLLDKLARTPVVIYVQKISR